MTEYLTAEEIPVPEIVEAIDRVHAAVLSVPTRQKIEECEARIAELEAGYSGAMKLLTERDVYLTKLEAENAALKQQIAESRVLLREARELAEVHLSDHDELGVLARSLLARIDAALDPQGVKK